MAVLMELSSNSIQETIPKCQGWTMQKVKQLRVGRCLQMDSWKVGATLHTEGKGVKDTAGIPIALGENCRLPGKSYER